MKTLILPAIALLLIIIAACGTPAIYPISSPSSADAYDRIIGNWKFEEDTNKANFYEITKATNSQYHVRFFDRGGTNPSYEGNIFFSKIGNAQFLNIPYWIKNPAKKDNGGWEEKGYFFLKIKNVNMEFTRITTATVSSKELSTFKTQDEIIRYISAHVNDDDIYTNTAHFFKVN